VHSLRGLPIIHKALPEISQSLWRTHFKGKITPLHLKDSNIFTYKSTIEQVIYAVWTSELGQGCNPNVEVIPFSGNALNLRPYLPQSPPKLTWSGRLYIDEVPPKNKTFFGSHAYTTIRLPILGIMV
jgi:hypothetical protein